MSKESAWLITICRPICMVSRKAGIRKHTFGLFSISQLVSTSGYFIASLFDSALEYATVKVQGKEEAMKLNGVNQAPTYTSGVILFGGECRFQRMEQKCYHKSIKKVMYVRSWAIPEKLPVVQPFRKFPAILRNPKVHHRVHKSPPLVPILS
jgi:hypothetical protein